MLDTPNFLQDGNSTLVTYSNVAIPCIWYSLGVYSCHTKLIPRFSTRTDEKIKGKVGSSIWHTWISDKAFKLGGCLWKRRDLFVHLIWAMPDKKKVYFPRLLKYQHIFANIRIFTNFSSKVLCQNWDPQTDLYPANGKTGLPSQGLSRRYLAIQTNE